MKQDLTIWVFGHSGCLPFNLPNSVGWANQLATKLGADCKNFAEPSADNLFIYHSLIKQLPSIKKSDIVFVGWSHPNRKSFVLDRYNQTHTKAIEDGCIIFNSLPEFFKSKGVQTDTKQKWLSMVPRNQGNEFFDAWFERYHHNYECQLNLQSYTDSAQVRVPCRYVPFYFSQESVNNIDLYDRAPFYWLDFIIENQYQISDSDMHPSEIGHERMANVFLEMLDNDLNNLYN